MLHTKCICARCMKFSSIFVLFIVVFDCNPCWCLFMLAHGLIQIKCMNLNFNAKKVSTFHWVILNRELELKCPKWKWELIRKFLKFQHQRDLLSNEIIILNDLELMFASVLLLKMLRIKFSLSFSVTQIVKLVQVDVSAQTTYSTQGLDTSQRFFCWIIWNSSLKRNLNFIQHKLKSLKIEI